MILTYAPGSGPRCVGTLSNATLISNILILPNNCSEDFQVLVHELLYEAAPAVVAGHQMISNMTSRVPVGGPWTASLFYGKEWVTLSDHCHTVLGFSVAAAAVLCYSTLLSNALSATNFAHSRQMISFLKTQSNRSCIDNKMSSLAAMNNTDT